jgi:colanic acid biosynthesis glycosyl transferase WcaI
MLASGRLLVATAIVGTELATDVEACGLVPPDGAMLFADALAMLAKHAARRAKLRAAGRQYADAFFG